MTKMTPALTKTSKSAPTRELIHSPDNLAKLVEAIYEELSSLESTKGNLKNGSLPWEKMVAFDTEFIRESTFFPVVEILQIATETQAWLVDIRAFKGSGGKSSKGLEPLKRLFVDKKITKVLHAYSGDQECLYTLFGEVATPVFDTAIAASLLGLGDNIGLAKLHQEVLGIELQKGNARTNWSVRPLPDHLLQYALEDVVHLVKLAKSLANALQEARRVDAAQSLFKKAEDKKVYEPDAAAILKRLNANGRLSQKSLWLLKQLIEWREKKARAVNIPRRWVAEDSVLIDLARVAPKTLEHLLSFRGLNRGEAKKDSTYFLQLFQKSDSLTAEDLSEVEGFSREKRARSPNSAEGLLIDFLKFYLLILADKNQVSVKHLVTQEQLLNVVRSATASKNYDEFKDTSGLSELAWGLVGKEIFDLLKGCTQIAVENGKVQVLNKSKTP